MPTANPSVAQLQRAIQLSEQIAGLEVELKSILSGDAGSVIIGPTVANGPRANGKRTMSPEARERIAAAQRAKWARSKGDSAPMVILGPSIIKPKKQRRKISPEARARIVAAQKKRWAKVREARK